MPEVLLYGSIESESATDFINNMNLNGDNEVIVRINSGGGSPEYGWGMITKFIEHKGVKKIKVDGQASSMALFFLCYVDDSEAIDTTQGCLHRAAYPSWFEMDMDEPTLSNLNAVNKSLRAALEAKIDVEKFEALKGVTLDEIFSNENRVEVYLTAAEMKKIGLINRVVKITPSKKAEVLALMEKTFTPQKYKRLAAEVFPEVEEIKTPTKTSVMTIEKLKSEFPEIAAKLVAEGVAKEKDRVGAWMAFVGVDAEAVKVGIASGDAPSLTAMSEFSMKAMNNAALEKIAADSKKEVETAEVIPAEKKAVTAFEAEVKANLEAKK